MPSHTVNHDYQLFSSGEEPWEHRSDFRALDTDVEIRDVDTKRIEYEPKDGAKFVATDTGIVYLGDGADWNRFGTISDRNVRWTDDPDQLSDLLKEVVDSENGRGHGYVRLEPGFYEPGMWTEPITIPPYSYGSVTLDMSGCYLEVEDASSFDGPWIHKTAPDRQEQCNIHGPFVWAEDAGPNLGTFMEINDAENSHITAQVHGHFDIGFHERANVGSGHMNIWNLYGRGMEIGLKVGDSHDDPSMGADRCWYFGQLASIRDIAVLVERGNNNHFFVQPETPHPDTTNDDPLYGYYLPAGDSVDAGGNVIQLTHAFTDRPVIPLFIEDPTTTVELTTHDPAVYRLSIFGCPPKNIRAPPYFTQEFNFNVNWLPLLDVTESGRGTVSIDSWNNMGLRVYQDGDVASVASPSQFGGTHRGFLNLWTEVDAFSPADGDVALYAGIWEDADNYSAFEADPSSSENWQITEVINGTVETDVDTGYTIKDDTAHLYTHWGTDHDDVPRSNWIINEDNVHMSDTDVNNVRSHWRIWIESFGTKGYSSIRNIQAGAWRKLR